MIYEKPRKRSTDLRKVLSAGLILVIAQSLDILYWYNDFGALVYGYSAIVDTLVFILLIYTFYENIPEPIYKLLYLQIATLFVHLFGITTEMTYDSLGIELIASINYYLYKPALLIILVSKVYVFGQWGNDVHRDHKRALESSNIRTGIAVLDRQNPSVFKTKNF